VRKFILLSAVIALWVASPSPALAAPTLTLSGTCVRDVIFEGLDPVPIPTDSLYRLSVAASGLTPNTEYDFRFDESPTGIWSSGTRRTDATGAFSADPLFIHGYRYPPAANPPPSLTYTAAVWDDLDRDEEIDPGEPVFATDTLTIVCPPRRSCAEIVRKAEVDGTLSHGEARSLRAKCHSAEASAAAGHTKAARNKLKAFIHEVRAMLRSRRISSTLGQELIESANARIATLP
jgi:hypothetical protein